MAKRKDPKNSTADGTTVAAKPPKEKKVGSAKNAGKKKPAAKTGEKEPGLLQKIRQFFREVKVELKKVTWPSRKETIASTSVVLVVVILVAVYLGVVDIILSRALKLLLH